MQLLSTDLPFCIVFTRAVGSLLFVSVAEDGEVLALVHLSIALAHRRRWHLLDAMQQWNRVTSDPPLYMVPHEKLLFARHGSPTHLLRRCDSR